MSASIYEVRPAPPRPRVWLPRRSRCSSRPPAHTSHLWNPPPQVAMHLEYYNRPKLQIRVVRILWMVPIYAVDAWFSLRFKDAAFYIDPVRECYEAFVIYNFFMYLVAYLEDEYGDIVAYYSTKEQARGAGRFVCVLGGGAGRGGVLYGLLSPPEAKERIAAVAEGPRCQRCNCDGVALAA